MKFIRTIFLVALASLSVGLFVPGCTTDDEVRRSREQAVQEKIKLDTDIADAKKELEEIEAAKLAAVEVAKTIPVGTPARTTVDEQLAAVSQSIVTMKSKIDDFVSRSNRLTTAINTADSTLASDSTSNAGTAIGGLVATLAPGIGVAAIPIFGAIYRSFQLARANRNLKTDNSNKSKAIDGIVTSIDVLASIEPAVREALEKQKATIDKIQTPIGKAAVDVAQAKNSSPMVPHEVA